MCVINYCVIIYHQYVCVHVLSDGNVDRYMIMDHQQYQCQSVCYVFKFMHEYSWDEHE